MLKAILKLLDLDNTQKHAEIYLVSKGGTRFKVHEALQWVNDNIEHAMPNIVHGGGGPALRILLLYRKRREFNAVIKKLKAKYDFPYIVNK